MSSSVTIEIVPKAQGWAVQDAETTSISVVCSTLIEAVQRAKEVASRLGGGVVIIHRGHSQDRTQQITVKGGDYHAPVLVPTHI